MSKTPKKKSQTSNVPVLLPSGADFDEELHLSDAARERTVLAVNKELIDIYWSVGEHISRKIKADGWGKGTVEALAEHIRSRQPSIRVVIGAQK